MQNGRPEFLEEIIESPELKDKVGEIKSIEEVEEGLNSIFLLEASERYILKVHTNPRNDIKWFRAEPLIYGRLEDLDIPSPEVIHRELSEERYEKAFFVMEEMPGVNPAGFKEDIDFEVLKGIVGEFGRILGLIHSNIEKPGYGMLGGFEGNIDNTDDAEKWTWHLQGSIEEMEDLIEDGWDKPPELGYPSDERIGELLPGKPQPVLLHVDNRLDNLLIDDNEVTAFLDWSHPEAGHHEYDIVRAEYLLVDYDLEFLGEGRKIELREILYEAYEKEMNIVKEDFDKRRKLYRKITVIWILAGFPNWGSEFGPDTKESFRKKLIGRAREEGL